MDTGHSSKMVLQIAHTISWPQGKGVTIGRSWQSWHLGALGPAFSASNLAASCSSGGMLSNAFKIFLLEYESKLTWVLTRRKKERKKERRKDMVFVSLSHLFFVSFTEIEEQSNGSHCNDSERYDDTDDDSSVSVWNTFILTWACGRRNIGSLASCNKCISILAM